MAEGGDKAPLYMRFHKNHSKSVRLSAGQRTAQMTSVTNTGTMVIAQTPMLPDILYQVQLDQVSEDHIFTCLGVVTEKPESLPGDFDCSAPSVVFLSSFGTWVFGEVDQRTWSALENLSEGSQVGLVVDSGRRLHLYINDTARGVLTSKVPEPCYFIFELGLRCTKVTALPLKEVSPTPPAPPSSSSSSTPSTSKRTHMKHRK